MSLIACTLCMVCIICCLRRCKHQKFEPSSIKASLAIVGSIPTNAANDGSKNTSSNDNYNHDSVNQDTNAGSSFKQTANKEFVLDANTNSIDDNKQNLHNINDNNRSSNILSTGYASTEYGDTRQVEVENDKEVNGVEMAHVMLKSKHSHDQESMADVDLVYDDDNIDS